MADVSSIPRSNMNTGAKSGRSVQLDLITSIMKDKDKSTEDKIYELIVDQDEVTWRDLIYKLVKAEGMDPWNVDISLLAKRYLQAVRKLKQMDFSVSGKIVLASALLLRIKSKKLVGEDLDKLDGMINSATYVEDEYDMEGLAGFFPDENFMSGDFYSQDVPSGPPEVTLKTPQPRSRKLTVVDLVDALEKAIDVQKRRENRLSIQNSTENTPKIPARKLDLKAMAVSVYSSIASIFKSKKKVFFKDVVKSPNKEDVVYSFIPLLHLDFSRIVDLNQDQNFGDIEIQLLKQMETEKEIQSSIKL